MYSNRWNVELIRLYLKPIYILVYGVHGRLYTVQLQRSIITPKKTLGKFKLTTYFLLNRMKISAVSLCSQGVLLGEHVLRLANVVF